MKKILIGMFIAIAFMVFVPQVNAPYNNIATIDQTSSFHTQEDLQASLLSVNAGNSLLPFIVVLGLGGVCFFVYLNKHKKEHK